MNLTNPMRESLSHLLALLKDDDVGEIEVEKKWGGWRVKVSRKVQASGPVAVPMASAPAAASPAPETPADAGGEETKGIPVKSPMVGTFYDSPSPDADSFVKEGDMISPGQTLCIIEAMKIMNEIEAETSGRIRRVLVQNGQPVEYNTVLFLLDPA